MQDMERMPTLKKEHKKKKKTNRILLIFGWIFFLSLSAIVFFQSPLSKVDEVTVDGANLLNQSEIIQLSQIQPGQSFFTVKASAIKRAIKALPEVKEVNVSRSFPGKVIIAISEFEYVAFQWGEQNELIPVLENGTRLENRVWNDRVIDRPILRSWPDTSQFKHLGEELKKLEPSIRNEISEMEPDQVEKDPQRVILYMKDGFEVHTSLRHFAKNMAWYPPFIANLKQEGSPQGIIKMLDGKWFVPYPDSGVEEGAT
ncbi:hypothetical protein BEP19_06755 [Ammoniphilus oxalaticus]|uniref:Cell division protein DivIB n=1 Tax=Ammoniphilus oxalaticus TaxID=66863 RepID=A0A419SJB2_9BACL|nr:FtsQ-type POTRA domain-containing protein [Ammoniphilus oxalaticus]RKD24103.1 hypothetical protein BEP19_06755 [Ammoniphilus oxalaticus]